MIELQPLSVSIVAPGSADARLFHGLLAHQAPGAFLDQTYHTWNGNPGVVENMTMVEGLHLLQEELAAIRPELVLAGECLTEISFQRQAFAQTHPWGWGNMQPVHVEAAHPICSYLWSGHTRLIGYIELEPWNPRLEVSIAIHARMGVLPTFVARERSAAEAGLLSKDHPGIKQILDWPIANGADCHEEKKAALIMGASVLLFGSLELRATDTAIQPFPGVRYAHRGNSGNTILNSVFWLAGVAPLAVHLPDRAGRDARRACS
jgi:hypothetical protein